LAAVVFRLQGNLPFNPNPKNPDDGGTTSLLSGCASPIIIISDVGAQEWVLAWGALASRASHGRRSAVKVTLGSLYRLLEAQPHTRLRAWEQNCASGRGDGNGILDRPSLPLLMVVHLESRA
jgi:hypothetical protein